MKQSTSFTQVANNLLTVLQGYSKTIRLLLVMFLTLTVTTNAWAEEGTINFNSTAVEINAASVTGDDDLGNSWTITTAGTTSFTSNSAYYQVGSSKRPATSITFTTTLPEEVTITSFSAKFGGFSGTTGNVTLKVGDTSVGTGQLNETSDVTIQNTEEATGKILTVTVTNISKGVKAYYISYTYTTSGGDPDPDPVDPGGDDDSDTWTLVKDVNDLAVGDEIVIAASDDDYALSTTQNSNNRGRAAVTKNGETITFGNDVQVLTLQTGNVSNSFAFYTGSGYLYAASSSSNHLKTENSLSNNSSWSITITNVGVATITAQGTNTRNLLRYNSSSSIFSCYSSGQLDVSIYKKAGGATTYTITSALSHVTANRENPTTITSETEDLTLSYSAESGWNLPENITITMGGNELTDSEYVWDNANGDLLIQPTSGFTGNIVVTINGWQQLAAPTGLNVTNITSSGATLKWNAVTHATSYTVQVYGENDEIIAEYTDLTQTTKEVSGLESDTYYIWAVTAIGDGTTYTDSEESETAEFTTLNPCEKLGAATGLTVETDFEHTDGNIYVKFSWTPADNTKNYAASQKLCFGKVGEAGTCVDDLAKNLTWTGDLKSKLDPGEYWWSIQALGDGVNYCDGDVVNGTNFTIEAPTYTVTFNAGSGTCDDESLTETSGGAGVTLPTANPPAACATDGWTFAGWWTEEVSSTSTSPGTLLNAGDTYNPTSDITLYAVYSTQEAGDAFTGYAKVTTAPDDWSGKYLLSTGTYTANGTYDSNEANGHLVRETYTPGNEEKADWEFTLAKVGNTGYSILFPDGSYYLGHYDGTNFGRSKDDPVDKDAYLWTPSTSGITNVSATSRKIADDGTDDFRPYSSPSSGIVYLYKRIGGGTTTIYNSNPTCLVPVWEGATIDKTELTVNCGERSSMDGAAKITFSKDKIFDFSNPITIEASEGFLVSTSRTPNENYQQSVSQSPLVGTEYPNTFNGKFVYVRAEAPAMSEENLSGTITIKNSKGETLQTFSVTADVTCAQYTLTLVDRGVSTEQPTKYYAGETIDEAPADPEGVCTDPIHYVFDGWAAATVAEGSTTYTKVTFPYTVEGNTKFYAVYRYLDDGGEPSNDFIKVTKEKDDWTGDYVIVDEEEEKAIGNAYENTNTLTAVDVTIQDNKVVSPSEAVIWQIRKHGENYTMYNVSANKYAYIAKADAKGAGLSATTTNTTQDIQIVFNNGTAKVSGVDIYRCFYYYGTNTEWRTYATGNYNTGALYCRSLESYLYTTSPVCGPHLAITEGKDIYVTGGNAGGTRDLVIAQQKVSYKATRLEKDKSTGNLPSIKALPSNIVFDNTKTKAVAVTFDEDSVITLQSDGTYTITGNITIAYQPAAANVTDDIQVTLNANYNPSADVSQASFTVHARSLPEEFVIVAKSGDKWYALNGDMNTNAANPANGQVTLDAVDNPTKATYAPCNTIYTFDGLPHTGDRTYVRFQGTDGAWLWAASGTNVGIQNNVLKTTPEGNNNAYNWKLYTQDNITYQFGNANSNRQLTLNGEKFGMYASGVQDIRILPYEAKCLYNYAPTNLKVSVLKGTYVTLTWDAVIGATKYQYRTDATNWTDCGTEPTVTINGLEGDTEYTYYIRAYHEDAGVSQECIDYAEITFTTANCDDVPTDITYTADLNSITVSWTAAAPTATIKYNTKEDGTGGGGIINNATSPYKISGGLDKNTTYYIQILADGTCASPIIPVKTEDVEVDIVEWDPQGIIVDINTDETIGVTLENEVSYGSGLGSLAEDLFFSKYFEGSGSLKMIAIYNGTGKDVDLSEYRIDRGSNGDATNISKTYDLSQLGIIKQGQEIIFYSWPLTSEDSYSCSQSFLDSKVQESGLDANPRWILCDAKTHNGIEFEAMDFSGNDPLLLYKSSELIDVFGVSTEQESPASTQICSGRSDQAWSADGVTNMDYGKTTEDFPNGEIPHGVNVDDETITAYTARVIMFRKNTVVSGKNAVTKNTTTFATFAEEWEARQVCRSGDDGDLTCAAYQELGTFDYSDYYTKYESMNQDQEFDESDRNADGTVTIEITDLYKHACSNIRVKLTNSNSEVLSDREYKVPIMITTTQGTNGQAFLALQENLATVEVDGEGKPTGNKTNLTLEQVREICKTCDVVVRNNATLTKVTDGTENDHPQVHDVIVYEGASIVIPDGTNHNYTINSLALRRKGDKVASAQVQGTGKFVLPADAPVTLSMRIDANNWHWFTLPYDCDIADVTWSDGTPAKYNTDWFLMYYDGESRAASTNPYDNHWKVYSGTTIEAGKGYIIGITGNLAHPDYTFELCFPMEQGVLTAEQTDKTVALNAWGVKSDNTPNNLGWNLVGNPYLNYYKTADEYSLAGLPLILYTNTDPVTGEWNYENSGSVPYVVTPINGGWYEYQQELASEVNMMPFTAYFVQVGDPNTHENGQALNASFEASNRGKKSILRRAQSEVDEQEEPAIVAVELTNAKGESDKTTLLIADRFTNEYEMNADFFKWFGDYYTYYTKPVLYTLGADQGKRAFNALNEELAAQPVALGMYAAQAGEYTFSLYQRSELSRVEEVWLHDATSNTHTNLMLDNYTFSTSKTDGAGRFSLSVKMKPKIATDIDDIRPGQVWATSQDNEVIVNGLNSGLHLWLYDAVGKLLYAEPTTNYQHCYTVPQDGVYFITVKDVAQVRTIKVVVE